MVAPQTIPDIIIPFLNLGNSAIIPPQFRSLMQYTPKFRSLIKFLNTYRCTLGPTENNQGQTLERCRIYQVSRLISCWQSEAVQTVTSSHGLLKFDRSQIRRWELSGWGRDIPANGEWQEDRIQTKRRRVLSGKIQYQILHSLVRFPVDIHRPST